MVRFCFAFLFGAFFVSANVHAEDGGLSKLQSAKTIRCAIEGGYTSEFDGKNLTTTKGVFSKEPEGNIVTFAKIDLKNNTAIVLGNAGTDDIAVQFGEVGLNFLDFTGSGAIISATVFANRNPKGEYFFVTSRHTQISFGKTTSLPSQWTGTCKVIE